MAKSTVNYLKTVMPGQPDAWYDRIASEITAGRMPLPKVEGITAPEPEHVPVTINPARERFLGNVSKPVPASPPKSVTPPRPSPNTPNTVGEALQQATHKPKRPAQPANATTKWKLERLVHSDKRAAERLAAQVAFSNPGKSEQWCWEKAIYDLERDRF